MNNKFRLSRKRKKKYKKDLLKEWYLPYHSKHYFGKYKTYDKHEWEWFYFKKRVQVRVIECVIDYPEWDKDKQEYVSDPKLFKPATNEKLLQWYKQYYPNDKLAHQFCKQNRHKWDRFNT